LKNHAAWLEQTREARREYQRRWRQRHPGLHAAQKRKNYARLREEILDAYGRACACCGETESTFLALDHVGGGGEAHRRAVSGDTARIYRAARREGFPPRYRLLCHNCNWATHRLGRCPHLIGD
jgi:hypothetical protein